MGKRILENNYRTRLRGDHCVYCGESATSADHWPPYITSNFGYILPSCLECNVLAGTKYPSDFYKRADYVKETLKKRYRKFIVEKPWTPDELSTLGGSLRHYIEKSHHQSLRLKRRLAWSARDYIKIIDSERLFAGIIKFDV